MPEFPIGLLTSLVFLVFCTLSLYAAHTLKISMTFAYIFSGILLGPSVMGLVKDPSSVELLGELGVLFLLFKVGLELPFQRLKALRLYIFGLGSVQVLLSTAVISWACTLMGFSTKISLFLGGALALSSTALIIQLLAERNELTSHLGKAAFSTLLFQDIAVVLLFFMVGLEGKKHTGGMGSSLFLDWVWGPSPDSIVMPFILNSLLGITVLFLCGRVFSGEVFRLLSKVKAPDLFIASIFCVTLGGSFLALQFQLPMELGAFAAGLSLADTSHRRSIEEQIKPFQGLLLGFFFILVGMEIQLKFLTTHFVQLMLVYGGLFCLKAVSVFLAAFLFKFSLATSLRLSLLLAGFGEFVFILFSQPGIQAILNDYEIKFLNTVTLLSMLMTPFWMVVGNLAAKKIRQFKQPPPPNPHVALVGMGKTSLRLIEYLQRRGLFFVVLEKNEAKAEHAKVSDLTVFQGDVANDSFLQTLPFEKVKYVVITPFYSENKRILEALEKRFPQSHFFIRVPDTSGLEEITLRDTLSVIVGDADALTSYTVGKWEL